MQPLQAALNSQLGKKADNPVFAVCVSGLLSGIVLGVYLLFTRNILPRGPGTTLQVPGYLWLGGVIGAAYLTCVVIATPKLGTGTTLAAIVAMQVIVGVALDHFAVLGLDKHPINWGRGFGVALFVAGAFLIQRF